MSEAPHTVFGLECIYQRISSHQLTFGVFRLPVERDARANSCSSFTMLKYYIHDQVKRPKAEGQVPYCSGVECEYCHSYCVKHHRPCNVLQQWLLAGISLCSCLLLNRTLPEILFRDDSLWGMVLVIVWKCTTSSPGSLPVRNIITPTLPRFIKCG